MNFKAWLMLIAITAAAATMYWPWFVATLLLGIGLLYVPPRVVGGILIVPSCFMLVLSAIFGCWLWWTKAKEHR